MVLATAGSIRFRMSPLKVEVVEINFISTQATIYNELK